MAKGRTKNLIPNKLVFVHFPGEVIDFLESIPLATRPAFYAEAVNQKIAKEGGLVDPGERISIKDNIAYHPYVQKGTAGLLDQLVTQRKGTKRMLKSTYLLQAIQQKREQHKNKLSLFQGHEYVGQRMYLIVRDKLQGVYNIVKQDDTKIYLDTPVSPTVILWPLQEKNVAFDERSKNQTASAKISYYVLETPALKRKYKVQ